VSTEGKMVTELQENRLGGGWDSGKRWNSQ
jgi:hypothetical protein